MIHFRAMVVFSGIICLAFLWGSYAYWYSHTVIASTATKMFLWSSVVMMSFLCIARIWDVWTDERHDTRHIQTSDKSTRETEYKDLN